jgi:hypothetical protein
LPPAVLACENPKDSDLPISQWSQSEVARQAAKRGIAGSISHGTLSSALPHGALLERYGPHF